MTDLLYTIPDFPTKSYAHLIPSLEKHRITTTDLLSLDALEIAKRAQLPLLDVRRLTNHVVATLQAELGLQNDSASFDTTVEEPKTKKASLRKSGKDLCTREIFISTLSHTLDAALAGGIPTGYITEITGERFVHPFFHSKPHSNALFPPAAPAKPNFFWLSYSPPNSLHPAASPA